MILEDKIQKRGLRDALKKEAPRLLDLLEKLQVQERDLGRTLTRLRGSDGSLGGYTQRISDGRILNYGDYCWDRLVMQDSRRAAIFVPLIRDIRHEMEKFFGKST